MALGEEGILAVIDRYFPREHPALLLGRGDDCAVLGAAGNIAMSTDIFAEHSHYRRSYFSARDIGCKALAVNVSDIGAAGARPEGLSMGLTLTGDEDEAWICGFCEGMKEIVDAFGLAVSGGDLSRAPSQSVCVTVWGRLPDGLPAGLRRGAARAGDVVFACGGLGLARAGLAVLEEAGGTAEGAARAKREWPACCRQHLHPLPLAAAGMDLARFCISRGLGGRVGLMDVSDGLARDLPRLLGSARTGLGAELFLGRDMLHGEVLRFCTARGLDPSLFAYVGGEDYALAGTCPAEAWTGMEQWMEACGHHVTRLGTVRPGGVKLNGAWAEEAGFDHFS